MGYAVPFKDDLPFEEKVKCLADEELLEIWAESQQLEFMINNGMPHPPLIVPNVEQTIIHELFLRTGRKLGKSRSLR